MKYYNNNGKIQAFFTEGATEITSPIREDGTVLPNHDALDTLEKDADGNLYALYNQDGTPDLVTIQADAQVALIANFKSIYLGVVDAKLKELDYDSLATVKLWEGDATFGAEATQILTWYKAIIAVNYQILTDVQSGARAIPTDAEYLAEVNAVVL